MSTIITHRQFPQYHKYTMDLAGRPLTLEVGKLAELANAAVMVGYGDTRVLCCVTAAPRPRDGIDFFPLSVDFEEKLYAVGRIPGSFNRREGRPGEKGILTSRVIDRPIRPLFPHDFRNDVSVMCTVMSVDHDCSPEICGLIGTSAALAISDIPWNGPVGALKVGLVDGKLVFNPTSEQRKVSDLDVTVVSTGKKVVMIEAGANQVPNDVMFEAIRMAHEENQKQIALIGQMVAEIGKPKFDYPHADFDQELFQKIVDATMDQAKAAMDTDDKNVREARWNQLIEKWHELFLEDYPEMDKYLDEITYKFQKKIVKAWLLEGHRVDGRQKNEIRPLSAEVGVLLSGLALVTGMLWARKSWGVWWTWDPRLTTTLIMWFVYAGYLVLRGLDLPPQRKSLVCAVVGVVAFLDVPLVFISARIWRSIHPAVFAAKGGGLEPEMKMTVIACVLSFGLLWAGLVWLRKRQLDLRARLDALAANADNPAA